MAMKEFKATVNARGFIPGKDISDKEWTEIVSEFIAMQNQFATMSNEVIDKINDTWHRYEEIKKMDETTGNCISTFLTQMTMGIDSKSTYEDWVEIWYKQICEAIDTCAAMAGFKIRSNIFRADGIPLFGAKFKEKPDWTMDITLTMA